MTATATKEQECPDCHQIMNFEARHTLRFNGGRGDLVADRFHCTKCRRFHNYTVPAEEENDGM
jgi:RNase P subunit RPR2